MLRIGAVHVVLKVTDSLGRQLQFILLSLQPLLFLYKTQLCPRNPKSLEEASQSNGSSLGKLTLQSIA